MQRNYIELFFRHRLLLTLPLVIVFVLGAGWGVTQPRSYLAGATLWTDAPLPNQSTVANNATDVAPSAGHMTLLNELLATRSFLLTVGQASPLAPDIKARSGVAVDYLLQRMRGEITVAVVGPQVMSISVKDKDPAVATGLASAVLSEYVRARADSVRRRSTDQLAYDQKQLDTSAAALEQAQAALTRYVRDHSDAVGSTDGTAAQLTGAVAAAQQQFATVKAAANQDAAALAHVDDASVLNVIDRPDQAYPQSRKKPAIFGAAAGLIGGLTISLLTLLLLASRDTAVRRESELEEALSLTVVGSVGKLPPQTRGARRGMVTAERGADRDMSDRGARQHS